MNNDEFMQFLAESFPNEEVKLGIQFPEITVSAPNLRSVTTKLRNNEKLEMDFLYNLTGVDINGKLGVVYHLRSTLKNGNSCVLKVFTENRETPSFETVSDIWKGAEYFEREVFDLFGISFNNHPDLRRLFLEDDFKGFPLRKDFKDEINLIER